MTALDLAFMRAEQDAARQAVLRAVRMGKLQRPTRCEWCGAQTPLVAHHADYAEPLQVAYICRRCHSALHRRLTALMGEMKTRGDGLKAMK